MNTIEFVRRAGEHTSSQRLNTDTTTKHKEPFSGAIAGQEGLWNSVWGFWNRRVAHCAGYDPIAAASFWIATPGPCASDLTLMPYAHAQRPLYPLGGEDDIEELLQEVAVEASGD